MGPKLNGIICFISVYRFSSFFLSITYLVLSFFYRLLLLLPELCTHMITVLHRNMFLLLFTAISLLNKLESKPVIVRNISGKIE